MGSFSWNDCMCVSVVVFKMHLRADMDYGQCIRTLFSAFIDFTNCKSLNIDLKFSFKAALHYQLITTIRVI